VRGVLVLGREYEVRAERDDRYILSGVDNGFSKTRFEIVFNRPCQPQRRGDQPSRDTPALLDHLVGAVEKRRYSRFVWFDRMTSSVILRLVFNLRMMTSNRTNRAPS
jgi:hypothetical protein